MRVHNFSSSTIDSFCSFSREIRIEFMEWEWSILTTNPFIWALKSASISFLYGKWNWNSEKNARIAQKSRALISFRAFWSFVNRLASRKEITYFMGLFMITSYGRRIIISFRLNLDMPYCRCSVIIYLNLALPEFRLA